MNDSSIKDFFSQHPQLTQCFETVDGILFTTEETANDWNATSVTTHQRATFIKAEPVLHKVTEADLQSASSVSETFGAKVGDTIQLAPEE